MRQGSLTVDAKGNATLLANEADKETELSIDSMQDYLKYLVELIDSGKHNDYQMKFLMEQRQALEEGITDDQE